jgi:hypothetical protein
MTEGASWLDQVLRGRHLDQQLQPKPPKLTFSHWAPHNAPASQPTHQNHLAHHPGAPGAHLP